MKIFLDDERETPETWIRTYTAEQTIEYLKTGLVTQLSLDHDLNCCISCGGDIQVELINNEWIIIYEPLIVKSEPPLLDIDFNSNTFRPPAKPLRTTAPTLIPTGGEENKITIPQASKLPECDLIKNCIHVKNGYDVVLWIEEEVALHGFVPPEIILIHSANPVGRQKMEGGIRSIYKFHELNQIRK